jgi:hypothetical protein
MSKDQRENAQRPAPGAPDKTPQELKRDQIGCLLRVFWMFVGNGALLTAAALISNQPPWTFSIVDGAYFLIVLALIGTRYFDITRFNGTTAKNRPATRVHFIRYSTGLVLVASVMWVAMQSV